MSEENIIIAFQGKMVVINKIVNCGKTRNIKVQFQRIIIYSHGARVWVCVCEHCVNSVWKALDQNTLIYINARASARTRYTDTHARARTHTHTHIILKYYLSVCVCVFVCVCVRECVRASVRTRCLMKRIWLKIPTHIRSSIFRLCTYSYIYSVMAYCTYLHRNKTYCIRISRG